MIRTVGIIAEFDPLHRGHALLLEKARSLAGPEGAVICAMSGQFTQRGGAAILSRHARAEMALLAGADLVLELPLTWATASAERFARGGVALLGSAGATVLLFGSECGHIAPLSQIAQAIDRPAFAEAMHAALQAGRSFAAARQQAAERLLPPETAAMLAAPNNLLGIEYLRAIHHTGASMAACTMRRVGAGHHDSTAAFGVASASAVRQRLLAGDLDGACAALPETSSDILCREWDRGLAPASLQFAQRAVLARLKSMREADFAALPDCTEGLENRLFRAARQAATLEEFYALARSRRYPHARIRRMALWAYLSLERAQFSEHIPYIRVLAARCRGTQVLSALRRTGSLPVLTKPAAAKRMPAAAHSAFELEVRAAELWGLCLPHLKRTESEWIRTPLILL